VPQPFEVKGAVFDFDSRLPRLVPRRYNTYKLSIDFANWLCYTDECNLVPFETFDPTFAGDRPSSADPSPSSPLSFSSPNSSGMNTEHPTKDANPERPSGAEGSQLLHNPCGMNTYKKCVRIPFRMNTCKSLDFKTAANSKSNPRPRLWKSSQGHPPCLLELKLFRTS